MRQIEFMPFGSDPNPAPFYSLYYFGDYRIEYVLMAEVLDTRKLEY